MKIKKTLVVALIGASFLSYGFCSWDWAPGECVSSSNCQVTEYGPSTFTCQFQIGGYCCQCEISESLCSGTPVTVRHRRSFYGYWCSGEYCGD